LLEQKKKLGDLKGKESQPVPQRKSKWDQGGSAVVVSLEEGF
jgi:hypothetical protein